jgi:hypothetical protein
MSKSNLPARPASKALTTGKAKNAALDAIRNAKPKTALAVGQSDKSQYLAAATQARRPRLVFGIDATASRQVAWDAARGITDTLFTTLPGEIDIALAVHSGGAVSKFTPFSADVDGFRADAARVRCCAGNTQLVPMMQKTLDATGVKVFLYIGDNFEEYDHEAYELASAFKARGVRAIMLHDATSGTDVDRKVFEEIARRSGGVCLDFYGHDMKSMQDIFEAVAVLAAGGPALLEQRRKELPGAAKLLPQLK